MDVLEQLLVKTSRTFALSIPALPQPTRLQVTLAYLLFRVADTLEDATEWTPERQLAELDRFAEVLRSPSEDGARKLARSWNEDPPLDNADYRELLSRLDLVLDAFEGLGEPARGLVREHTLRTVEQMQWFVRRTDESRNLELRDVGDLRAYCYAVAGIVGEMLTELFLVGRPELDDEAPYLRQRAARFGEALQLVNILKDSEFDATEGRRYLPAGVGRGEVFALAREDLEEAGRYVAALQRAEAPRGVVAFCALPVLLAWHTLDRVEREGPGSKLTRPDVARIVQQMETCLDQGVPAVARPQGGG